MPERSTEEAFGVVIDVVIDRLKAHAREDTRFRTALHLMGTWLRELAEETAPTHEETEAPKPAPQATAVEPKPDTQRAVTTLKIGDTSVEVPVEGTAEELRAASEALKGPDEAPVYTEHQPPLEVHVDLDLAAKRLELKTEACRWAVTRRARLAEDASFDVAIRPKDRELMSRAKTLQECYAWPLDPYAELPDDGIMEDLAACYENVSEALQLAVAIEEAGEDSEAFMRESYELLAEAQSALRRGLSEVGVRADADQLAAFGWLRQRVEKNRVYIDRHMRLEDPADPAAWDGLRERISNLGDRFEALRHAAKKRTHLIGKVRYICRQLQQGTADEYAGQWANLAPALEELIALGLRPSDRDLRELLLPVIDSMPDDLEAGSGLQQILAAIDRYLASRDTERGEVPATKAGHVAEVAQLLKGQVVLLIGGQRRPEAQRALQNEFELAEMRWISTTPHQSVSDFEAQVAREEVGLVMLAVRWSSHSFEGVRDLCAKHGKPYVRLPAGYGVNRVASDVLEQVSEQLRQQSIG